MITHYVWLVGKDIIDTAERSDVMLMQLMQKLYVQQDKICGNPHAFLQRAMVDDLVGQI